ncbi:hypothetical protein [Hyphococcus lacteus]|uniref:Uncharacterized protein n=1 Tax=Hyphococcus lacteus TaxID=3143536 RepID=A0ABV3Z660_9PROT
MTGNLFIDSSISLLAIGSMVLLAWLMFRGPVPPITMKEAAGRLAFDEPDFQPLNWFIDCDGRSALVEGAGGEYALVSRLGVDLVTRRFPPGIALKTHLDGDGLTVFATDITTRSVRLCGPDAAQWASKLAPISDK